jgi:hypothetical protein
VKLRAAAKSTVFQSTPGCSAILTCGDANLCISFFCKNPENPLSYQDDLEDRHRQGRFIHATIRRRVDLK